MPALSDDRVVGEGVAQEVDVLAGDLAGEDVSVFVLAASEELEWVGAKLQSTAQVGDEAVLNGRFTLLPEEVQMRKASLSKKQKQSLRKSSLMIFEPPALKFSEICPCAQTCPEEIPLISLKVRP